MCQGQGGGYSDPSASQGFDSGMGGPISDTGGAFTTAFGGPPLGAGGAAPPQYGAPPTDGINPPPGGNLVTGEYSGNGFSPSGPASGGMGSPVGAGMGGGMGGPISGGLGGGGMGMGMGGGGMGSPIAGPALGAGGANQGFYGSPFSYSPNAGPMQERPRWDLGGWGGPPPVGTPTTGSEAPQRRNPGYGFAPPRGPVVPSYRPGMPGYTPPTTAPVVGGRPGTPAPGGVQKSAPVGPAAGSQDALMQAVLTGQGGGAFTPGQLNQYGPPAGGGGGNWADTLKYYQANQGRLNRQGPQYQPGGMFYNKAIDG